MIYFSNVSTLKDTNTCLFHSYKFGMFMHKSRRKVININKCNFFVYRSWANSNRLQVMQANILNILIRPAFFWRTHCHPYLGGAEERKKENHEEKTGKLLFYFSKEPIFIDFNFLIKFLKNNHLYIYLLCSHIIN